MSRTAVAIDKVMTKGAAGAIAMLETGVDDVTGIATGRSAPRRPMTLATRSPWSCAGKPLLAMSMRRFVAAGELDLDKPVHHWRPEFARLHPTLTPRSLLGHKAGVNDKFGPPDRSLHDWPRMRNFEVGVDELYSAWWNWRVLGLVLEAVAEKRTETVVEEEILKPSGMRSSTIVTPGFPGGTDPPAVSDIVQFATDASDDDGWLPMRRLGLGRRDPTSRICGPLSDLLRFYQWVRLSAEATDGALPVELVREFTGEGRGFAVDLKRLGFGRHCSPRSFGFGGAVGGRNVVVGLADPEYGFSAAVLVNRIGRESALGLKAICTAIYEDVAGPSLYRRKRTMTAI
jgi:CubicO group peptidase (beta-lactamase class C family)